MKMPAASVKGPRSGLRRVCYLAPDVPIPYPTGASVHVVEVANSLSGLGHEVHVIARRSSAAEPETEVMGAFTVHRISRLILKPGARRSGRDPGQGGGNGPLGSMYYLYLRSLYAFYASVVARKLISAFELDVILERETSFGAGGLASFLALRPLVLEIVGPRYSRLSAARSSSILYYNESMLRRWVDREKCVKVPAGVNLDLFKRDEVARETTRSRLALGDETVVGYVGSFLDWHGVDILLEAVSMLRTKGKSVRVVLVGHAYGPYLAKASELGISAACTFVGPVPYAEVPSYMNACDILVAPYNPSRDSLRAKHGIGFPLKLLEYMACEKPVVSTEVAPIDALFGGSGAVVLVPPSDPASLARAIEGLAEDGDRAGAMAREAHRLVEERYSWGSFAKALSAQLEAA